MALHDWWLQARIDDIFPPGSGQAYVTYELLDPATDSFKDFCVQCGTTFDDARWTDNLDGLYQHLGQQHALDLAYEFSLLPPAPLPPPAPAYVATAESHPSGLDPWVANMGKQRQHYSMQPRAGPAVPLPADALAMLSVSLLRFVSANSTLPDFSNWKGLSPVTEDILITATVAGCQPGMSPATPADLKLEGFELPKPCRSFVLDNAVWTAIPVVSSPAEAWALRDADPTFEWCSLGHTGVLLDDHTTWGGNAFNRKGESVLSGSEFAVGAKPNFDELLKLLGYDKKDSLVQRKLSVAEGLASLSAEAAFNMATASKGKSHSAIKELKLIPREELSALLNPMTGDSFPPLATAAEKLSLVAQSTGQASQKTFPCDVNWWCLICNGSRIAKAAVGEFSIADLENGKFELTDRIKADIITLEPGEVSCSVHATPPGAKGRGYSYPPQGARVPCPAPKCRGFLNTLSRHITQGHSKCGTCFGGLSNNHFESDAQPTGVLSESRQLDEMRFVYLCMAKGDRVFEGGQQRRITSLAGLRLAMNLVRSNPYILSHTFRSDLSMRKIGWLGQGKFCSKGERGLWIFDFIPAFLKPQPGYTLDQLNTAVKLAEDPKKNPIPQSTEPLPDPQGPNFETENMKYVTFLLLCLEIALEELAAATSSGYLGDIPLCLNICKSTFLTVSGTTPYWVVFDKINYFLEDTSRRLEYACTSPSADYLTTAERTYGGAVRWIYNDSCEGVLRNVTLVNERGIRELGWDATKGSFTLGAPKQSTADQEAKAAKQAARKKRQADAKAAKETAAGNPAPPAAAPSGEDQKPKGDKGNKGAPKGGAAKGDAKGKRGRGKGAAGRGGNRGRGRGGRSGGNPAPNPEPETKPVPEPAPDPPSEPRADPPTESVQFEEEEEDWEDWHEEDPGPGSGRAAMQLPQAQRHPSLNVKARSLGIRLGELHGEGAVPTLSKMKGSLPRVRLPGRSVSEPVCPHFNSGQRCSHPTCSFLHEVVPLGSGRWTPAWMCWFGLHQGHVDQCGRIDEDALCSLLTADQAKQVYSHSSEDLRRDLLLSNLMNRLTNLVHATNEPIATLPVTQGDVEVHRDVLWNNHPDLFPLAAPSGLGPARISRVIVGSEDAVHQGIAYDTGQDIGEFKALCPIKAVASMLSPPPDACCLDDSLSPDRLLLEDCIVSALKLDWSQIPPDSLAGLRLVAISRGLWRGQLLDSCWSVLGPHRARNAHVYSICAGTDGPLTIRLNLVHSNVSRSGELLLSPSNIETFAKRHYSAEAISAEVVGVLVSGTPEGHRHSEGFQLGKGFSLLGLHKKIVQLVRAGKCRVIVSERAAAEKLSLATRPTRLGTSDLEQARQDFIKAARKLKILDRVHNPRPAESLSYKELARREAAKEELDDLLVHLHEQQVKAESAKSGLDSEDPDFHDLKAVAVQGWSQWFSKASAKFKLTSNAKFAEFFFLHLAPRLKSAESKDSGVDHGPEILTFASQFFNLWLRTGTVKWNHRPRLAFDNIVAAFRDRAFKGRASEGPEFGKIHEMLQSACSKGHVDLLRENMLWGADPLFIDTRHGKGLWHDNLENDPKFIAKILQDQVTEVLAFRGLVFDFSDPQVKAWLLECGIRVSPVISAVKKTPHGTPALDKQGEVKLRMCVHCSYGDDAPNDGMRPSEHTRQKTTTPSITVQKTLQEEQRFPNHPVRFSKHDVSQAFRQVAVRARRVGLFATAAADFVLVSLTMIFGAGPAPGDFEPLGDAVMKIIAASPRDPSLKTPVESDTVELEKLQTEHLHRIGPTHPQSGRFVDDVFSSIAMYGDRCGDHLRRVRLAMTSLMGPGGINEDKMDEEGLPSNFKHAFGVVLDAVDRLVMAPWSKIVKLHDLAVDYVNGIVPHLTLSHVEEIRGVAHHVLFSSPGLGRFVLPRLDACLSDAYRQYPGLQHPPNSCIPSPRLAGESEEQGHAMLRRSLNLLLRLSTLEKGKLIRISFEMALDPDLRMTWPGKEGPDSLVHFLMDASGTGLFLIDLATGRFIKLKFTEAEQQLFNAFELGEGAVNISHRELLSELFGVILLGPEHAGKLINLINDNTAAEGWTTRSRHRHAKVDQVLALLGLSETLLKQTLVGSRVKTKANFADTGTRDDLREEFERGLKELEQKYGWTAQEVEVEPWLRDVGWDQVFTDLPDSDWFSQALSYTDWLERTHPGLIFRQSGVEYTSIRQCLHQAALGDPISQVPTPDGDFEPNIMSAVRRATTRSVPPTATQHQRKLTALRCRLGEKEGCQAFCRSLGAQDHRDPQQVINDALQQSHEHFYSMVRVENKDFDEALSRPVLPPPKALSLGAGFRLSDSLGVTSSYTGTGSVDTALVDTSHAHSVSFCEHNPALQHNFLLREPQAECVPKVADYLRPDRRFSTAVYTSSPPCPSHSQANLYRRGNADSFGGTAFQEEGGIIENLAPMEAHLECTLGVLESQGGKPSPMSMLKKRLPSYWVVVMRVDAGKTVSPATGLQAAMCHERVHVLCFRKSCFPVKPTLRWNQSVPLGEFRSRMDSKGQGREYRVMPSIDQKALVFGPVKFSKRGTSIATVFNPEPGRGHHNFPNVVEDADTGSCSVTTAASGSKWITRSLNGKCEVTRLRNEEVADIYCALDRGLLAPEWLADNSHMGQHALGNMIPPNVADWLSHILVQEAARILPDGDTPFEKWSREEFLVSTTLAPGDFGRMEPSSGGKKRGPITITAAEDSAILDLIDQVSSAGKKARTISQYTTHFDHWGFVADAKGWSRYLDGLPPREKCRRVIYWLAWERKTHAVKASTLQTKLSAVRWAHVRQYYDNPFSDCPAIHDWLANLQKIDGPAQPKLPVPLPLIQMLCCLLEGPSFAHTSLRAAILTGFWFLLRSIEYLAEDDGFFDPDRSITWGDVTCRKDGRLLPLWQIGEATDITLTLYSSKNSLETCTRTLTQVLGSDTCVVQAFRDLHAAYVAEFQKQPSPGEAVFKKSEHEVYRRKDVSQILKLAADATHMPKGRVASHSLRRGGCSQYVAAGPPGTELQVQRFGRWTSEAYKGYVWAHNSALHRVQAQAAVFVPRFERN